MSDYPKQMRHRDYGEVTVLFPPDPDSYVPIRWPNGCYQVCLFGLLSPIPSPDDPVEVVVKMKRDMRDRIAKKGWVGSDSEVQLIDACRAHRDAEEAP